MMRIWSYLRLRLRGLLRRETVSHEIRSELQRHIEQETLDLIQAGWPKRDARLEAKRRFGDPEEVYARCSEQYLVRGSGSMLSFQDVKVALRVFRTSPGFALAAVLMIGLGIGATTTMFSVVDHVLLRPLPYPASGELVTFGKGGSGMPIPDYVDVRDRTSSFESLGAVWAREQDMTGLGTPERLNVGQLTSEFLPTLGARSTVGRLFVQEDFAPHVARVAVLSQGFWRRRFGGNPTTVGETLTLEGTPYEIVGVLGGGFVEPEALDREAVDVWTPIDLATPFLQTRNSFVLRTVARLANGRTLESAQEELDALAGALAVEHPDDNRRDDGNPVKFSIRSLHEATVRDIGETLSVLMGAVGLMLLIACANVANLFFARTNERAREMAVRSALGAGKLRLLRQVLTESVTLGLGGGILGVLLAVLGVKAFAVLNAGDIPRVAFVAVDWRIVGFAIALSLVTGILFGMLPALHSTNADFSSTLKDGSGSTTGSRTRNMTRDVLVVVEIALALVLLVGAGLMFNSFLHLRRVDPGFNTENVLTAELRFGLPFGWGSTRYGDPEPKALFTNAVLEATRSIPGVLSAGGSLSSPFGPGCCWKSPIVRSDRLADTVDTWIRPVTFGYMETIGARITAGRLFTAGEDRGELFNADVTDGDEESESFVPAIVNSTFATRMWPAESPIGEELIRGNLRARVIGVVEDVSNHSLDQMSEFDLYVPFMRTGTVFDRLDLTVRYTGQTETVAAAIREAVWNIDPDLPVGTMVTMDRRKARSMNSPRFYSILFAVFATLAFLIAAFGIYASMTYVVGQRKRELGIRLALGGEPQTLLRMMMGQGALLAGMGVVIGVGGALALSRLLDSLLFGITTTDPATFVSVAILLSSVAMLACYVPSRKAAAADPLEVLKAD